jgi:hypothetical protein
VSLSGIKGSKKGPESENAKIADENNVDCFFDAKGVIHNEFVSEKQTVNGRLYKKLIRD